MRSLLRISFGVLVFVVVGTSARQERTPAVTVVFFGEGAPVSYECDEVAFIGNLSDGRPQYRCSVWGKTAPRK
jgi:hypothetical protein